MYVVADLSFLLLSAVAIITAHYAWAAEDHDEWSYEGATGPDAWGLIEMSGNNQCAMKRQSPIDIEVIRTKYDKSLKPLALTGHDKITPSILGVNNGHTGECIGSVHIYIYILNNRSAMLSFVFGNLVPHVIYIPSQRKREKTSAIRRTMIHVKCHWIFSLP